MPLLALNKARRLAPAPPDPRLYAVAIRNLPAFAREAGAVLRAGLPAGAVEGLIRQAAVASAEHSIRLLRTGARRRGLPPEPALVEAVASALVDVRDSALDGAYTQVLLDGTSTGRRVLKREKVDVTVEVNPASVAWARQRGGKLIQGISARQRELVRRVVARGLERGQRADTMAAAIRRAVGLTERDEAAVERRRTSLLGAGAGEARAESEADEYAGSLLEARALRIARTETVAAQNMGLLDGWREAQEAGELPADQKRVWVSAPESPNPNRPCAICLGLDGQAVGLDEPFISEDVGEVWAAPAHVSCRCTAVLRRSGGDE